MSHAGEFAVLAHPVGGEGAGIMLVHAGCDGEETSPLRWWADRVGYDELVALVEEHAANCPASVGYEGEAVEAP